jgi:hypothetical protein
VTLAKNILVPVSDEVLYLVPWKVIATIMPTCELGWKAHVPVSGDVLHLVLLPLVEHPRHVQVVGVVRAALPKIPCVVYSVRRLIKGIVYKYTLFYVDT